MQSKSHTKLFYKTVLALQRSQRTNLRIIRLEKTWKISALHAHRLYKELVDEGLVQDYWDKDRKELVEPKVYLGKVNKFVVSDAIKSKYHIQDKDIELVLIKK